MGFLNARDITDDHVLIDVRTPAEFRSEKIPQSVNMPLDEIQDNAGSLQHQENIVLVCASGNRAQKAREALKAASIEAIVLEDGLKGWKSANKPTEVNKSGIMSLERQVRIAAGFLAASGGILALTVHPYWALLSTFVGCGLVFAGITDTCGMAMLLAKLPFNRK